MRQWTAEEELNLFRAICQFKPLGINKHFHQIAILNAIKNDDITLNDIREKLETLYDLNGLEELENESDDEDEEDDDDNEQDKIVEFELPWDQFNKLILEKASEGVKSPVSDENQDSDEQDADEQDQEQEDEDEEQEQDQDQEDDEDAEEEEGEGEGEDEDQDGDQDNDDDNESESVTEGESEEYADPVEEAPKPAPKKRGRKSKSELLRLAEENKKTELAKKPRRLRTRTDDTAVEEVRDTKRVKEGVRTRSTKPKRGRKKSVR